MKNDKLIEAISKARRDVERAQRTLATARTRLATLEALQQPAPRRIRKRSKK